MEDEAGAAKKVAETLGELVRIAGNDPTTREAASEVGKTALVITKTINNALLPLVILNATFDKARNYFNGAFQQDLIDRTRDIPLENIVEPKASIAGPALQGMVFSLDETDLKSMFLGLLATAMDGRIASNAHPAFVEIIKQLEGHEARLLGVVLERVPELPIVQLHVRQKGRHEFDVVANHLTPTVNEETGQPQEMPGHEAVLENWVRLGLVEIDYSKHLATAEGYSWVIERPEYKRVAANIDTSTKEVVIRQGILSRTAFGLRFAKAVGLVPQSASEEGVTLAPDPAPPTSPAPR